ncbi:hypothetical protein KP509_18G016800 [Ceratopteris richardii]|uniref:NADH dehydrogenase [ubiquinone] 1 alpha subcomplex subunit 12 n=1 Tax=Ceratopteris richardii TaxID=49495 RepID=A0A8T2SNL0_CERRI|nr:hypothetical protein KP509_18G016800 [Ceratopteris richardii]KAH7365245.1 hypothetical protein KP509_18G016800 [Ceratopteris richardii]KAH7365246.1 hypothetical protein KP509_18G016800 [Ceratopteris richardii]
MAKYLQRLWSVVRRRELVGKDSAGNLFYRWPGTLDTKERRWVEYAGDCNPRNLPAEWYTWLIGSRKEAPTPAEIMAMEAYRRNVKMKAAMLEKEEEKRRFRHKSLREDPDLDAVKPPEMSKFVQQVAALEGLSFSGEEKTLTEDRVKEVPALEESNRTLDKDLQSGKSAQNGHKIPSRKEREVYEKWVPPS